MIHMTEASITDVTSRKSTETLDHHLSSLQQQQHECIKTEKHIRMA